jgi:anti-anti-sigma regulatory factor
MQVKIDTREKFTLLTPETDFLSDNLAVSLISAIESVRHSDLPNLILKLDAVSSIDDQVAIKLAQVQNSFYEDHHSFVICQMQEPVEATFEKLDLLDSLNFTPTESEAWDIVQMEEIERELMDDDHPHFNNWEEEDKN